MKKIAILSAAIASIILSNPTLSFGKDSLGCLTCHGYPGLVKRESADKFKALHIDEERQLKSAHGKVECRECHAVIRKVPHTGETQVDCTTKCHLNDKDKIMSNAVPLSAFHKDERFAVISLEDKSSCRVCHPLYPHSANIKVRAFVNMHTGFFVCEVCHLRKENAGNLIYEWREPERVEFTGGPYGTHKKHELEETDKSQDIITRMLRIFSSREDQTGKTRKTEYVISRIAVFSVEGDKKKILVNTRDNEKASDYKKREKNLSPEEKEMQLKYFHKDIERKEISVACDECHSLSGILDFKKLGFDEKRAEDLKYLNIKILVTKYDVFYLPSLLGH